MFSKLFDDIFRDQDGNVVIFQFPNAPLMGWLAASLVAKVWHGGPQPLIHVFGQFCLLIWAFLEIRSGTTLFRRFLGIVVLVALAASINSF